MINLQTTRICWGREVKGGRPCGGILTKWGACWVLVYLDTWCSAANSSLQFPHPFFSKCKNIALEGQNAIPSRSAYKQGFFPIDSEKTISLTLKGMWLVANGGLLAFKPKVFPSLSLQCCCLFAWHWGYTRCSKKPQKLTSLSAL